MKLNKKNLIRLFILTIVSTVLISCGQDIEGSEDSNNNSNLTPELNPNIILEMQFTSSDNNQSSSHLFENSASVTLPNGIYLKAGTPDYYRVNLVFNTRAEREQRDAFNEFYCQYESTKTLKGYINNFVGCFQDIDNDGVVDDLGYRVGQKVIQDKFNYVRIDLVSGQSPDTTEIWTELEVTNF